MVKIVELDGQFAGWRCELRPISGRILIELHSGSDARALAAFALIIVSHNFKGWDGEPVTDWLDAPAEALEATMVKWAEGHKLDPK